MLRKFLNTNLRAKSLSLTGRSTAPRYVSNLSENEFLKLWEEYLEDMLERLEEDELSPKVEDYSETVESITIECEDNRIFVINRHVPNREIWYSSPVSGPSHFEYRDGAWINKAEQELEELIEQDMNSL